MLPTIQFQDKQRIGIGSGSTIVYAVERLGWWSNFILSSNCSYINFRFSAAERVQTEKLSVVCVPTSFQVFLSFATTHVSIMSEISFKKSF